MFHGQGVHGNVSQVVVLASTVQPWTKVLYVTIFAASVLLKICKERFITPSTTSKREAEVL